MYELAAPVRKKGHKQEFSFLAEIKRYGEGWIQLLDNNAHLLVDTVHKQEPQRKWLLFILPPLHK